MLMDIQLNDGICFSIFEQVEIKSSIIFTTAFDHYAIQAFRVNSVDYLLKPVKESDLERALGKFEGWRQTQIPIACFVSESRVTSAVTWNGDRYVVDFSLDGLEEELDTEVWFRADRRTIVHIDLITRFEDYFGNKLVVKLKSPINDKITVSRLKASAFKMWVGK